MTNDSKKEMNNVKSIGLLDKLSDSLFSKDNIDPRRVSLRIVAAYIFISALWILLSDEILQLFEYDKETLTLINMIKGLFFVAATGVSIYVIVYSFLKKIKNTENKLVISYQNLFMANLELNNAYEKLAASEEELRQQYEELIESQEKLQISEERYRIISEAANDAIWEEENGVRFFSDRWFEITGYSRNDLEMLGGWEQLIHPEDKGNACEIMLNHINKMTQYYRCEYRLKTKQGKYMWIQARGKALFNEKGEAYRIIGSHTDITELKEYEQELNNLAYYDQVTGLQNRRSLNKCLGRLIEDKAHKRGALIFIDVDNFKYVNDTMGHTFGDRLINSVGQRLAELQRNSDMLFRLGGDEFVILMDNYADIEDVERLAVSILKGFKARFDIDSSSLFLTVSIGISIYPEHGKSIDALLKSADIAVYKAKETGRNRIVVYSEPMNEVISERMHFEKHLRSALENNEFELLYQPQLDIKENKITGFEALIRWNNDEIGFIPPAKFIGIAEATHLIVPIGEWVLKNACLFLKRLHQKGSTDIAISVNVSMLQLLQDDFVEAVMTVLESVKLNPKYLELEITESIIMESYEMIAGKLKLLKSRGIRIALDDFGKGYSSLNYLRQLPISTLKIDKSFIDTISAYDQNKSLTNLIVRIGKSMGLCVVAEGVETQQQFDYLAKYKCNRIQGYLFSKPITGDEVMKKFEVHEWGI